MDVSAHGRQAASQGAAYLSRRGVDRFGNEGSAGDSKQSSDQELCSNRRAGQRAPRLTHVPAWMPRITRVLPSRS